VRIGGRRLHELAREGIEVERPPRPVTVYRLQAGPVGEGILPIEVECSSGTYIRSLAADLGRALGGGAHLRNLRRTAIGSFGVDEAIPLDKLGPDDALSPTDALRDYPSFTVDDEAAVAVAHGRILPAGLVPDSSAEIRSGPVAVLDRAGQLLAVYEPGDGGCFKAAVVLTG
jgi:tRNA pseudouridine55 synthase